MKSIGFTFDEKIIHQMPLEAFFEDLPAFDALEIAPDLDILNLKTYKKIVSYSKSHHFHVPYFVSPLKYDFSSLHFKSDYNKFFSIIESLRQFSVKTPSIVVHGSLEGPGHDAFERTLLGLDHLLNFIMQKKVDVNLSLETLRKGAIGDRTSLIKIMQEFDHERLGICLDYSHDFYENKTPARQLAPYVNYVHLHHEHDSFTKLPKELEILDLNCHHNLEVLINNCSDYKTTIINDLQSIKKI